MKPLKHRISTFQKSNKRKTKVSFHLNLALGNKDLIFKSNTHHPRVVVPDLVNRTMQYSEPKELEMNQILEKHGGAYMPDFGPSRKMSFSPDTIKSTKLSRLLYDCIRKNPQNQRLVTIQKILKIDKIIYQNTIALPLKKL